MKHKILFLLTSLAAGGAEKQTISLINNLDKNKFIIDLFYLDDHKQLLNEIDENDVRNIKCLYRKKKIDIFVLNTLKNEIKKNKYDIVCGVNMFSALYVFLVKIFPNMKFISLPIMHTTIINNKKELLQFNLIYKPIFNKMKQILFVCENQLKYWELNYKLKTKYKSFIYNGIDTDYFANYKNKDKQLKQKYNIKENDFIIGICAGLRKEKRHLDLLKATKILKTKNHNIKVLIIGDGVCRSEIEKFIKINDLSENVIITGFQKDVRPYIDLCNCMVICSDSIETFSIAVLESMAMAKPLIITDIGGANEQIDHGINGFLYTPGIIEELQKYIEILINDRDKCKDMGKIGQDIVKEKFTIDLMTTQYTNYFLKLIEN